MSHRHLQQAPACMQASDKASALQAAEWLSADLRQTPTSIHKLFTAVRTGSWSEVSAKDIVRVTGKVVVMSFWLL